MEKLITLEDIQAIRQITSNVDNVSSIDPYIIEAQNVELRRVFGIKFFYVIMKELQTEPLSARADALLNGTDYELPDGTNISFPGIKPLIAYYAYARAIPNIGKRVARFGVVQKITEFSEPVDPKELAAMVIEAKSNAKIYEEDLLYYLNNNKDTYPEFHSTSTKVRTSVNISHVGGRRPSYE